MNALHRFALLCFLLVGVVFSACTAAVEVQARPAYLIAFEIVRGGQEVANPMFLAEEGKPVEATVQGSDPPELGDYRLVAQVTQPTALSRQAAVGETTTVELEVSWYQRSGHDWVLRAAPIVWAHPDHPVRVTLTSGKPSDPDDLSLSVLVSRVDPGGPDRSEQFRLFGQRAPSLLKPDLGW